LWETASGGASFPPGSKPIRPQILLNRIVHFGAVDVSWLAGFRLSESVQLSGLQFLSKFAMNLVEARAMRQGNSQNCGGQKTAFIWIQWWWIEAAHEPQNVDNFSVNFHSVRESQQKSYNVDSNFFFIRQW
jgi:hypothetical protein